MLPYDKLPTREGWNVRAESPDDWVAYHAKQFLAKLARGEKIPAELPYLVQTWNFGDEFAMVLLASEPVADFAVRLKKEYDAGRLWVGAYANNVPTYIPSKRVWQEGGYEAGAAMISADHRPGSPRPWKSWYCQRCITSCPGSFQCRLPDALLPQ